MKKVAYFFAGFLPLAITVIFQLFAIFFVLGIGMLLSFPVIDLSKEPGSIQDIFRWMISMDSDFNAVVSIIFSTLCILFFGIYYYRYLGGDFLPGFKKTFSALQVSGVVVLIPGAQFFCSYLVAFISLLMPRWLEQYEALMESAGMNDSIPPIMLCYAVIMAPIGEELVFRGATMRLFRQALPFFFANICQAILFGILHANWIQGIYAFALGILLGYVCEKGGSIYYSILMHILFNFWGTVISQMIGEPENEVLFSVLMLLGMVISLVLGIALFATGVKKRKARSLSPAS